MRITAQRGGIMNPPVELDSVDAVTIETDDGVPIAVALAMGNAVWVRTANESDFQDAIEKLGFTKYELDRVEPTKAYSGAKTGE